jgi:predicted GNAT family N-acyltransferase
VVGASEQAAESPASPSAPPAIEVVWARPGAEFEAVLRLRRQVFRDEQRLVSGEVADRDDWRSLHALAVRPTPDGWRPVGAGRLTLNFGDQGEALIAWLATLPEARRQGVGRAVMGFLLAAADTTGAPLVILAAQSHAESFYRRLGFVPAGKPYVVRGLVHRWMARRHPRSG